MTPADWQAITILILIGTNFWYHRRLLALEFPPKAPSWECPECGPTEHCDECRCCVTCGADLVPPEEEKR